jgi:Uma2 family endonuclease
MPETAFPPPPDKGYTRCANSDLVIEDDEPADSILSKKLQRLLTGALYTSFQPKAKDTGEPIPFLATANVGLFYALKLPPLMPDVTLSLEVAPPASFERKEDRTYLVWEMGKPPDVVIEIVSKRKGEELGRKRKDYARAGVSYYAVYDRTAGVASPLRQLRELQGSPLALFQRRGGEFVPFASTWLEDKGLRPANAKGLRPANAIGLGLTLWQGSFEGVNTEWLRWCDREGEVLPTGEEKAALEHQRAERERQRAEAEYQRAERERQRAEALLELLRSHGKGLRPANAKGLRPANAIAPPAA